MRCIKKAKPKGKDKMYIDSHCHLTFDKIDEIGGQNAVIKRAKDADVGKMLCICTHIEREADEILALSIKNPDIWCTIGTHPHNAKGDNIGLSDLINLLNSNDNIIGIGETGLDYYYDNSPRDAQKISFRKHIKASLATGLPLIIHTRDAENDTIDILHECGANKAVMHCFSGSRWLADKALEMGFYISVSGIITFKKADDLRDIIKSVPLNRLLIETDAPYLAPQPYRGKINEPSFVVQTAKRLAEIKGISEQEIAQITSQNFCTLFNVKL